MNDSQSGVTGVTATFPKNNVRFLSMPLCQEMSLRNRVVPKGSVLNKALPCKAFS
jgi:hypothetical protein